MLSISQSQARPWPRHGYNTPRTAKRNICGFQIRAAKADIGRQEIRHFDHLGRAALWRKHQNSSTDRRGDANIAATIHGEAIQELARSRSDEHTSELQSLMRTSYAVF